MSSTPVPTRQTSLAIAELDSARVKPFKNQPRKRFRGIKKLAQSIIRVGQTTPIVVTECDDPEYDAELIDGERRLRACQTHGLTIRAVFDSHDGNRFVRSVAANFCRQDHDAVEIMEAVCRMKAMGMKGPEIGEVFGKAVTWVQQYWSLRRLAPEVLDQLKSKEGQTKKEQRRPGRLSLSLALLLVPLPHAQQTEILQHIQKAGLSIDAARTFVKKFAAGRGVAVGKKQTERQKFGAVRTAVERCSNVVERYISMPGCQIQPMIRSVKRSERRELAKRLESLCDQLLMLSDALVK